MTDCPALEIRNLTVGYRANVALDAVELQVPKQVMMGLVGPNGAGKSTLLKAALNLIPRLAGTVQVLGKPFSADQQNIAYVPQKSTIDWDFPVTVGDLVLMGSYGKLGWFRRPGKKEKELAAQALERVGMQDYAHRQIGELSGGQQQRAFLARSFVQDAPIYFLDEPFTGVDVVTEQTIVKLLHELRDSGKTIVIVQHDLNTIGEYLDQITLINRRVIASGPVDEVFNDQNISSTYQCLPGSSGKQNSLTTDETSQPESGIAH